MILSDLKLITDNGHSADHQFSSTDILWWATTWPGLNNCTVSNLMSHPRHQAEGGRRGRVTNGRAALSTTLHCLPFTCIICVVGSVHPQTGQNSNYNERKHPINQGWKCSSILQKLGQSVSWPLILPVISSYFLMNWYLTGSIELNGGKTWLGSNEESFNWPSACGSFGGKKFSNGSQFI